jgi:hypothetical protein
MSNDAESEIDISPSRAVSARDLQTSGQTMSIPGQNNNGDRSVDMQIGESVLPAVVAPQQDQYIAAPQQTHSRAAATETHENSRVISALKDLLLKLEARRTDSHIHKEATTQEPDMIYTQQPTTENKDTNNDKYVNEARHGIEHVRDVTQTQVQAGNVAISALKDAFLEDSKSTLMSPQGSNNAQSSSSVLDALRDVILQAAKRIQNSDAHQQPQLTNTQTSSDSESGRGIIGRDIAAEEKKSHVLLSSNVAVAAIKDELQSEAPPWTLHTAYRRYSRGKDGVLAHWSTGTHACM